MQTPNKLLLPTIKCTQGYLSQADCSSIGESGLELNGIPYILY